METGGNGDVIMKCVLRDGIVSSFHLGDVLHRPVLRHHLKAGRKLQSNQYTEFEDAYYIPITQATMLCLKLFLLEISLNFQRFHIQPRLYIPCAIRRLYSAYSHGCSES